MNFVQRAISSVTRKKGKSFILFLVIFVLGNVIAGAVAVQQSSLQVEEETKQQLGARATVEFDYNQYDEDNAGSDEAYSAEEFPKPPSLDVYKEIGASPYVKYFDYNYLVGFDSKKLKAYSFTADEEEGGGMSYGGNYFNLKGVNYGKLVDIEEGKIKLVEGETFSDKQIEEGASVAVVSKQFADENNVAVGNQLVLDATNESMGISVEIDEDGNEKEIENEPKTIEYPVTIIGLFEQESFEKKEVKKNSDEYYQQQFEVDSQLNLIYMPNLSAKDFSDKQTKELYGYEMSEEEAAMYEDYNEFTPLYVLKSTDDVTAFKEETEPLLTDYYILKTSADNYEQIGSSMQKMTNISKYVLIIATLAALLIISLVVLLFMRDRKHELGIYLSLGEKRSKVMGQIVIELLIISVLALALSLVTGKFLGDAVSQSLMNADFLSAGDEMYYGGGIYDPVSTNLTANDVMANYQVTFSAGYILTYLLVGIGTVLLSAIVPLMYIVRLNPKKIMM